MKPPFPKCFKQETKPSKFCPGCGQSIILKMLGEVIDELRIASSVVYGCDIGCMLLSWDYFNLNTVQTHHGRTVPTLVGLKKADPSFIAIAYMGDGGAYAIGSQHFLAVAHRNDPLTVIVANNTNYAMTGGQMAPTTFLGEKTTTTPKGRNLETEGRPIMGPELVKFINPQAYAARGSTLYPLKLKDYFKKAILHQINNKSLAFVEVLSACPTNWHANAKETIEFLKNLEKNYPLGEK